ncbi:Latrophilin Cirl [Halotydeus destructor]|nr:Latrophilin Cirl [Halotydeus destructor]
MARPSPSTWTPGQSGPVWVGPRLVLVIIVSLIALVKSDSLQRPVFGRPHIEAGSGIHYLTTFACEGSTLHMSCDHGQIHLVRANYGRFSISTCNDGGQLDMSVNCMSYRSFLIMQDKCNQKANCSVIVSSKLFGDPCPGTYKYLEARYHCSSADLSTTPADKSSSSSSSSFSSSSDAPRLTAGGLGPVSHHASSRPKLASDRTLEIARSFTSSTTAKTPVAKEKSVPFAGQEEGDVIDIGQRMTSHSEAAILSSFSSSSTTQHPASVLYSYDEIRRRRKNDNVHHGSNSKITIDSWPPPTRQPPLPPIVTDMTTMTEASFPADSMSDKQQSGSSYSALALTIGLCVVGLICLTVVLLLHYRHNQNTEDSFPWKTTSLQSDNPIVSVHGQRAHIRTDTLKPQLAHHSSGPPSHYLATSLKQYAGPCNSCDTDVNRIYISLIDRVRHHVMSHIELAGQDKVDPRDVFRIQRDDNLVSSFIDEKMKELKTTDAERICAATSAVILEWLQWRKSYGILT